jgi:Xaa-Pro aminopeptidase
MRILIPIFLLALLASSQVWGSDKSVTQARLQRAAAAFSDGILLIHANSEIDFAADGFRQDPYFYYFTGLENARGAILGVVGKSGEGWLFLPPPQSFPPPQNSDHPNSRTGPDAARELGVDHVGDWSEFEGFLEQHGSKSLPVYYVVDSPSLAALPSNILRQTDDSPPLWIQVILQRWPKFEPKNITRRLSTLIAVQSEQEVQELRSAAHATVAALNAGMRAIAPNVSQRAVEATVEKECWNAGAHGVAFWPWAMAGENGVFPRPFASMTQYDHLDRNMRPGELVRLDVGCEWNHYQGDLGRTVPVSGHYSQSQRELWNIFVAAYHAGVGALREGVTIDQVFAVWRDELLRHRASAKTLLSQHAIDSWSKRENVPFWQIHSTNLVTGVPPDPLVAGVTVNFEPIASIEGQGFFIEDMYLIEKDGAELLTSGVPYSAEEIEAVMRHGAGHSDRPSHRAQ